MKTATATTEKAATFQTPHEQIENIEQVKVTKKSKTKKAKAKVTKPAGRDAFGGRIGSRMSKINLVVINAGKKGATVQEVAEKTKESASIVSAQLGWAVNQLKVATRKEEKLEGGKKAFRYFAKSPSKNT